MPASPARTRPFEALANSYRRQLLLTLYDANAEDEERFDPMALIRKDVEPADPDATKIALYHVHLPKLAEMGFIRLYPDAEEIATGPNWSQLAPLLQLLADHRDQLPEEWFSRVPADD